MAGTSPAMTSPTEQLNLISDSVFKQPRFKPSLRAKRSNPSFRAKKEWIASSRSLSSGAHSRDPLAPPQ
jgi:hypothetical protein